MTQRKISLYSVWMDQAFESLAAKVSQFVHQFERLRAENIDLRRQLAAANNDAKRLNDKIDGARDKLENLLARLPE